ncbi:MAG: DUF4403 family protein, partial [Bacteroidota bacterium]
FHYGKIYKRNLKVCHPAALLEHTVDWRLIVWRDGFSISIKPKGLFGIASMLSFAVGMNTLRTSILNIPIALDLVDLELLINNQLKGLLYEDDDMNDNGGDKLMARVEKDGTIQIQLSGQSVQYLVPLKIWLKKGIGPASFEAQGGVNLRFLTHFEIDPDWTVHAKSLMEGFEWTQKPVINLGIFNMPVELVASNILKKSSAMIAARIDQKIEQNFNLRLLVRKAWQQLSRPILLSKDYDLWLALLPKSVQMTPLRNEGEKIHCTISVETLLKVVAGPQPKAIALPAMPPFRQAPRAEDDFKLYLQLNVGYDYAGNLAAQFAKGKKFGTESQLVSVEQINLSKSADHMAVKVKTSGSFRGEVLVQAKPKLLRQSNEMRVDVMDLQLVGGNFLMRSVGRLLKGVIMSQLEQHLQIPLTPYLELVKKELREKLQSFEFASEIFLNGALDELSIQSFQLREEDIEVLIESKGHINIIIAGLSAVEEKLKPRLT